MKRILISLFALFLSFGLAMNPAEAKRFGGGKSFGMQRTAPARQSAAPTPPQLSARPIRCGVARPKRRMLSI